MLIGDKKYSEFIGGTKDWLRRNTVYNGSSRAHLSCRKEVQKFVGVLSLQAALQAEDADV